MVVSDVGLIAVGAGLAIGAAALGSGIGQGIACAAGAGVIAEKEELMGKELLFAAIPETQAIYGFVIAAILLFAYGV